MVLDNRPKDVMWLLHHCCAIIMEFIKHSSECVSQIGLPQTTNAEKISFQSRSIYHNERISVYVCIYSTKEQDQEQKQNLHLCSFFQNELINQLNQSINHFKTIMIFYCLYISFQQ